MQSGSSYLQWLSLHGGSKLHGGSNNISEIQLLTENTETDLKLGANQKGPPMEGPKYQSFQELLKLAAPPSVIWFGALWLCRGGVLP